MFRGCIAGGYYRRIKYVNICLIEIFVRSDCLDYEDCTIEILSHEILHFVLDKIEGSKTSMALDRVHRPFFIYDCAIKKWKYAARFIHEKNGKITII
jgi:hypothetical protein